jgi:hypothetical protein
MYYNDAANLQAHAATFPLTHIEITSLKFNDAAQTAGVIKFRAIDKGHLFYETKDLVESAVTGRKGYAWRDAAEDKKVFVCPFSKTEFGIWVRTPSKPVKRPVTGADGTLTFEDVKDDYGRQIYKDTIRLEGHASATGTRPNRTRTLKTMLNAAIEVKAGRFQFHVGDDMDHFFAWRELPPDQIGEDGRSTCGVRREDVEKLREQGIEVRTQPALKSCANCSNCYRMFEADDDSGFDVPGLRSRPVSELAAEGSAFPRLVCMDHLQFMDIDAVDYVNKLSQIDNTGYTNRNGWRQKVGQFEVVVDKFQYGKAKTLISQRWEGEEEDGEPIKEYAEEEYEGVNKVVLTMDELIALRLEAEADFCPMWTRVEQSYGYYEWAKVDKTAVFAMAENGWEFCKDNKAVKRAGKNWKFAVRYHGIELSYLKKSPLERQHDFLNDFDSWIHSDVDLKDSAGIEKMLAGFEAEKPDKAVRDQWLVATTQFVNEVWPLTAEDTILKSRLENLVGNLITF